ncbi:MAG: hypothetical protein ABFC63_04790 [Thermoguttaceae bacterium]
MNIEHGKWPEWMLFGKHIAARARLRSVMTVYEHAMIGINGTLAIGLYRRHGWQIVALAGVAAEIPDLDGLAIVLGPSLYADGHRYWGAQSSCRRVGRNGHIHCCLSMERTQQNSRLAGETLEGVGGLWPSKDSTTPAFRIVSLDRDRRFGSLQPLADRCYVLGWKESADLGSSPTVAFYGHNLGLSACAVGKHWSHGNLCHVDVCHASLAGMD